MRPELSNPTSLRNRAGQLVRARLDQPILAQVAIGAVAALLAVGVRLLIPLESHQMPTLPLVVTLAIVTTFVGVWCGIATALVGGILSWYFFFNPYSWSLGDGAWIPLLSLAIISVVIVTTAQLYRSSERRLHAEQIADLENRAATSDLFAREMAHRLKNSLAIVQSIAFQTVGKDGPAAQKFAGRLKALADANDVLAEHVQAPTARASDVVAVALRPFDSHKAQMNIGISDAIVSAQQAISLALAIHELATNAMKYGALSNDGGTVRIAIENAGEDLRLVWEEQGGPKVTKPATGGFGTRLLERAGTKTRLDFAPDGLKCEIRLRQAQE